VHFRGPGWGGQGISGPDGTFVVTGLGAGEYEAVVQRADDGGAALPRAQARVSVPGASSEVTGVRLIAPRGGLAISGRATRGGKPAVGATIVVHSDRLSTQTQTDFAGSFRVDGLDAGRYQISGERHLPGDVVFAEAGATDVHLELHAAGIIRGALRGFTTTPLVAAGVGHRAFHVGDGHAPQGLRGDVQGDRFVITDVPAGAYTVAALGADGRHASARVTVAGGETVEVSLTAEQPGRIVGTVIDWRTRRPLAGVLCTTESRDHRMVRSAATGPSGDLDLLVGAGTVRLHCGLGDRIAVPVHDPEVEVKPGATARISVELVVGRRFSEPGRATFQVDGTPPRVVIPGTSALREGDLVRRVDGADVTGLSPRAMYVLLSRGEDRAPLQVTVERDGAELTVAVEPSPRR
jgi:hypothetical protein